MVEVGFLEGLKGEFSSRGKIGSATGDHFGIELVDRFKYCLVVDGEWRLEKRAAGKCHQPDTVFGQGPDNLIRRQHGAGKAIGCKIVSQHAARCVDGDNEVAGVCLGLNFLVSQLRAGQGCKQRQQGKHAQGENNPALRTAASINQLPHEFR